MITVEVFVGLFYIIVMSFDLGLCEYISIKYYREFVFLIAAG